jgi:EmrB/QacA subfamily drug resistance transporter
LCNNCSVQPSQPERQHYNVTLAVLGLGALAFAIQQTMVLPALPAMQADLHASTTWATWIFTGFLLSSSVLTPILGKLGDQYGKERLLAISLAIFLVASIACAFAWDIWSLIAFRAVAGAGAAVFPLSFAIINDEFPKKKAGAAIGTISAVMAAGGGIGLPLSGILVDHLSWRWLFGVGAVGVGLALVLIVLFVPESPIKTPSSVDYPGAALLTGWLVAFLVAMSEGASWGWSSPRVLALLAAALVLLPTWVAVELRRPQPLIDMRMLAQRTVAFTNLVGVAAGFVIFGSFVLIPQLIQAPSSLSYGFGGSATEAGLVLLPGAVMGLFAGPLTGVLGQRFGYRVPLTLGMALSATGLVVLAAWHGTLLQLIVGMSIVGVGIPFAFASMAKLVVDNVRPEQTAVASGMNTVMRTIGGVIGGTVGATLLTADTISGTHIPAESAYTSAFLIGAVVALLAAVAGRAARVRPALA